MAGVRVKASCHRDDAGRRGSRRPRGLGCGTDLGSRGVGGATEDQRRSRASAKLTVSSRKS